MSSLMRTASWVIVNKTTGVAVFETFNENTAKVINDKLYKVIPILEYLQEFNRRVKCMA